MRFKPDPYRYRRRLPHLQSDAKPLFVTFHTLGFNPISPAARDIVLKVVLREHKFRIYLYAVVVMPEHVHLLFICLRDKTGTLIPMRKPLQAIKSISAKEINRLLGKSGPVWDEESLDHILRSGESLEQKREYIENNPVRRGLVTRPEEYPWLWVNRQAEI